LAFNRIDPADLAPYHKTEFHGAVAFNISTHGYFPCNGVLLHLPGYHGNGTFFYRLVLRVTAGKEQQNPCDLV
jgi:hypothetical protein